MSTFVLVPGAWLGAWAWEAVAADLRRRAMTFALSRLPAWPSAHRGDTGDEPHDSRGRRWA